MRILVGTTEIGGIGKGLVRGLINLEQDAQLVLSTKHPFDYGFEQVKPILRLWQLVGRWRAAPKQSFFRKAFFVILHKCIGLIVLIWAIFKFDAFLFLYGSTFTDTRLDLIILRLFKKKIIFINMGSDIRPPYMDGITSGSNEEIDVSRLAGLVAKVKRRAILHEHYADFIVAQPSNAHFYERPIINWFSMGVPQAFDIKPHHEDVDRLYLRILHSPSNPRIKGSEYIIGEIQALIDKGAKLELVCLQGVSNDEVLRQLQNCDFVVDQLFSDIPMAVLASEAARFSKPCIIAGYLADQVASYIPQRDMPPSLYVLPENLRQAIEKMSEDADFRHNLGTRANEFVSRHWTCEAVAERYLLLVNGDSHSDWWFDPSTINYVGGCGIPKNKIAKLVALLIETYGVNALQVRDKPVLENALVCLSMQSDRDCSDA